MRRYRKGVGFVMDELAHCSRLDRNAKARLLHACEILERTTKAKGRRNGALGLATLAVLRCLLLRFHNAGNGRCCPSYDALQGATGFCRETIARAIERLEAAGVLVVTRRLVRVFCQNSGTALVRQGSNIYAFRDLPARVPLKLSSKSWRIGATKPRVYGTDGKYKAITDIAENSPLALKARPMPEWLSKPSVPCDADWRTKARAMFSK